MMSDLDSVSLQPDTWGDVDRYVDALLEELRCDRQLVLTEAFVFRDQQAAALVVLPPLVLEHAGRVLSRLREIVPQTLPDQVVVLMAWAATGADGFDLGVRDLRWTRESACWTGVLRMTHRSGRPVDDSIPLDLDDLLEVQVTTMFDGEEASGLLDLTDLSDDEGFFVRPEGPLGRLLTPCEWHHDVDS